MTTLEIIGAITLGVVIGDTIAFLLRIPLVRATIFSALLTTSIVGAIALHPYMVKAAAEIGILDGPIRFHLIAIQVCLVMIAVLFIAYNLVHLFLNSRQ